ncbi:polysaccharide ABC transporter ATP-binding protein [Pedobacter sp. R-06]|uniref:ABC transporter ATP-binding protein n=1 Tax=Pedobacter sp. R-06 TaxID=3404051 RepID=UPI003CF7452F
MSKNIAIKVENLSKAYQLGQIGTGTISRDLERWYARTRGKEDPFLRIGESNNQNTKSESNIVWSLKDINFEIEQGDAVGIIGRNGAGKSTLLKILSKVTSPTMGKISGKGRIASLLEVGTGFHPELSGRENIFLNGAILGMRKKEIQRKLEEIVDFAGIERYLDTPVKRYSSGMYVRLAFAVAAHLESEILIVDEVLAVGDAEFQKKCLGKMGEVSKGEGKTVLFVSHNIPSLQSLCSSAILLENGTLIQQGNLDDVLLTYTKANISDKDFYFLTRKDKVKEDFYVELLYFGTLSESESQKNEFSIAESIGVKISYKIKNIEMKPAATFAVCTTDGTICFMSISPLKEYQLGDHNLIAWIPKYLLNDGEYIIKLGITTLNPSIIHIEHEIKLFVSDIYDEVFRSEYKEKYHGLLRPLINWQKLN